MEILMFVGMGVFVVGLMLSHVVVAITRRPVRAGEGISKRQRLLMWASVAVAALGLVLGLVGFFLRDS